MRKGPAPRVNICHPDKRHHGLGLCQACYNRARRNGTPGEPPMPAACAHCGREETETRLVRFNLVRSVWVQGRWLQRRLGSELQCESCYKRRDKRRHSRNTIRKIGASIAAALLFIGCTSGGVPAQSGAAPTVVSTPTAPPVASPSREATASPVSTTGSPSARPASPRPGAAQGYYIVGQYAWKPTDDYRFWVASCQHQPTSYHDAFAFCSTPVEIDNVDPVVWQAEGPGDPWHGPVPSPSPS